MQPGLILSGRATKPVHFRVTRQAPSFSPPPTSSLDAPEL